MAVYHFTAPDLIVVRGWQPIENISTGWSNG